MTEKANRGLNQASGMRFGRAREAGPEGSYCIWEDVASNLRRRGGKVKGMG